MTPILRRLLLALVLVPQLAVVGLGSGLVLCVAPGGHLRVELAASGCCSEELPTGGPSSAAEPGAEHATDAPACPSCEDVDLLVDTTRPERESVDAPAAPPGPVQAELSRGTARLEHRCAPPRPRAHLTSLRTVVLRC